jgi:hypothetical protein
MTGDEFVLIITLLVSIMNQVFALMNTIVIVDTSPQLTLYGLTIFVVFAVMTADFIKEIRSA